MKFLHDIQRQCFTTAVEHGWWPFKENKRTSEDEYGGETTVSALEVDLSQVNIPEKLMLMVSEISEAMEHARQPNFDPAVPFFYTGERSDKPDGLWIELADCIIRIFDLAGAYGINMDYVLERKMEYNKHRPYRHGGKKF